ncbi:hypothetical protein ACRQ5D_01260 [Mucilaginibacter sp. P25]|uniref:Uncharacterized protein n=1 Tax=Mucilaginibacter gossypii TaxID=551996 RepID=A0A1G7WQX7_9SPHI|nr:hypothetical protein [Mucilaginibacter gossypii]SDG74309.1 hypothetical protein SAMN05192573_104517 [Mucilaginibacter gossypii]
MGLIKPYIRSIKVVFGILLLIGLTIYAVRREIPLKRNIQGFVKENFPVYKNYEYIDVQQLGHLDLKSQIQFGIIISPQELDRLSSSDTRVFVHKFRLNDTLYKLNLCVNSKDSVIAMGKPLKVLW